MKRFVIILATVVALVGFMTAGSALATIYNGALWDPTGPGGSSTWSTNADNPSLGAPGAPATATFTVPLINFSSQTAENYGAWLNTPTVLTQPSPNWVTNTAFYTVGGPSPYIGTFMQFTWQETFSSPVLLAISLTHDDGAYLTMGNNVLINSSSPTVAITDTFSGMIAAGTYDFVLNYGGVNGFPEVLTYSQSATPVPVPPTVLLMGSGLLGLVGLRFRRKSA